MLFDRETYQQFKKGDTFPVMCKSTVLGTYLQGVVYDCEYRGGTLCLVSSEDGSTYPFSLVHSFWGTFVAINERNV